MLQDFGDLVVKFKIEIMSSNIREVKKISLSELIRTVLYVFVIHNRKANADTWSLQLSMLGHINLKLFIKDC